jgi:hypothetical protein
VLFLHGGVHRAQLGAGLVESGAGSKLTEKFGHAMDAAGDHGGGKMMRADDQVADNLSVRRIGHRGFKDADDRSGTIAKTAESYGLADHIRIFFVNGGPETICQHDNARGLCTTVLRSDETAENRTQTHYIKVVAADHAAVNHARFAESDHRKVHRREIAELAYGADTALDILDFWHGKRGVVLSAAGGALADIYQPVLVAVDERLKQHSAHEREDGGVGADAQRQREDHNGREAFAAPQRVKRKS